MASVSLDIAAFEKMSNEAIFNGLERVGIVASSKAQELAPRGRTGQLAGSIFYRVDISESKTSIIANTEYAATMEYGDENRVPKNKQYLTVPISENAIGKNAESFPDSFILNLRGRLFIVRKQDKKGKLEFLYVLKKKVSIPAQPYLTPAITGNIDKLNEAFVGRI